MQLETLGLEGNPLTEPMITLIQKEGTASVISYLRENMPGGFFFFLSFCHGCFLCIVVGDTVLIKVLSFVHFKVGNPPQEREWIPLEEDFASNSSGKFFITQIHRYTLDVVS